MSPSPLQTPSPRFIQSAQAAINYWQQRTLEMDDDTIRQLDNERQNLFQAVQLGLTLPQTQPDTALVALQAFNLIERKGYSQEWIPILEQAVASCTDEQFSLKLQLLSRLGQLQRITHQLPAAIKTHQKAEALAQQLGDKQAIAIAYCNLCGDHLSLHDYTATEKYGQAALTELNSLKGLEHWQALTLGFLGELAQYRGDPVTSEKMLTQALTIRRQLKQSIPLARALNNLANSHLAAGKLDQALPYYEEVAELLTSTPYELEKIVNQINLGALYFQFEQWAKAEAALRQIDFARLAQTDRRFHYEAAASQSLGNVLLKQGRPQEAMSYLQRAVELWRIIDNELEEANSTETLGEALVALGRVTEALPLYKKAIVLLKKFPDNARAQKLLAEFKRDLKQLVNENQ